MAVKRSAAGNKNGASSGKTNGKPVKRRAASNGAARAVIGAAQVKHLLRAPGGYADIVRQFAYSLEKTNFRGEISPARIRSMLARGERLNRRAADAQTKAAASHRRIHGKSQGQFNATRIRSEFCHADSDRFCQG